jgi:hypothetical protein
MSQLNLSARAYHRILKSSRTITDLAGNEALGIYSDSITGGCVLADILVLYTLNKFNTKQRFPQMTWNGLCKLQGYTSVI